MMLRDDTDFDQSGAHIWTEHGQKIAVIWGEDGVEAGDSNPNLDVGHLVFSGLRWSRQDVSHVLDILLRNEGRH